MSLRRRRILALVVLGGFAVLSAIWLLRLDYARKISIDVLDLIPSGDRSPELALARQLASEAEARTMLFAVNGADGTPSGPAAIRLAVALERTPEFEQAIALADPAPRDALGRELFAQRLTLLFPSWLAAREQEYRRQPAAGGFSSWLAADAAARLERFLAEPAAMGFQDVLAADPLLLLPGAVDALGEGLAGSGGGDRAARNGMIWARITESPLSAAGQEPVFAAIARAADELRGEFPGAEIAYTGVNRFAAASRGRIQQEVAGLNAASLAAVLAIGALFIRQLHRGVHLLPVVLIAVTGAAVASTIVFDRIHVVVFVIGSMLMGVAVDYGCYLFLHPPAYPGEEYPAKVRRLLRPLLASCLTTVAGFSLLLASELPLIRQVGLFVAVGLLAALGGALLYFGTLADPHLPTRGWAAAQPIPAPARHWSRRVMGAVWLLTLPGLAQLTWRDDIQELEIPSPELRREDARIRGLLGAPPGAVYLTRGDTLAGAREALDRFETWLRSAAGTDVRVANVAALIPAPSAYARAVAFLREAVEFPGELRAALAARGFDVAEFAPFFAAYARHAAAPPADATAAARALAERLAGPQASLLHIGRQLSWFVTITDAGTLPPPADTQTVAASQLQSLNHVFTEYRTAALRLSLAGLALLGVAMLVLYGLRKGLRIFAISCGACLGIFGVFGWLGEPLNMFHLLGAFVGVCLTHDYAIFTAATVPGGGPPPVAVRISALTTAASFTVLAMSSIPVVSALGVTVSAMVLAALVAIELEAGSRLPEHAA